MAQNFMDKRYSPEDALKTLEFLQSAVDSVRRVMVGILDEHMEEAQRIAGKESGGNYPAVVMAINPSGYIDVFTAQEFQHMTEEDDAFCEQDIIFDDLLLIHCNPEDVVDLGGIRYLLGTAVIVEMDENGNECSVTHETIENAFDYVNANLTTFNTIFGTTYTDEDELRKYMKHHKTECAMRIFDAEQSITFPNYIMEAIKNE